MKLHKMCKMYKKSRGGELTAFLIAVAAAVGRPSHVLTSGQRRIFHWKDCGTSGFRNRLKSEASCPSTNNYHLTNKKGNWQ